MTQCKKYLKTQSQKHKETENYTGNVRIWKRDLTEMHVDCFGVLGRRTETDRRQEMK